LAVQHRAPADALLLITVVFWSFNFTVTSFANSALTKDLLTAHF
jgi:hypothetical protein